MTLNEAIIHFSECLLSIHVGAASLKSGHIHVSSYYNSLYNNRKYFSKVELQETEEILESCEIFLKVEEENSSNGKPSHLTKTIVDQNYLGKPIILKGIIDLVYKWKGQWKIIDYKNRSSESRRCFT